MFYISKSICNFHHWERERKKHQSAASCCLALQTTNLHYIHFFPSKYYNISIHHKPSKGRLRMFSDDYVDI